MVGFVDILWAQGLGTREWVEVWSLGMLEPQLEQNQSRLLTRSYRESLLQSLADPAEAAAYRDAALRTLRRACLRLSTMWLGSGE